VTATTPPRRRLRRLVPVVLAVAVIVGVFGFALPRIASYGDVLDVVRSLSRAELAVLLAATVLNVVTFAPPWMSALPGLRFARAIVMTQAATAASSVLPGGEAIGAAVGFRMLRAWGYGRGLVAATVAVISSFNVLIKAVFPVLAVVALLFTGADIGPLGAIAAIGCAVAVGIVTVVALALRRESSTLAVGRRLDPVFSRVLRLLRRAEQQTLSERLVHFRREAVGLLGRRWASLVVWTFVGHLTVFLVLLATVWALDVSKVNVVQAFAAWSLTRLLTAIPITPGGLGIVELGLTGALVAAGAGDAEAIAAVLVYRALTWLPPILTGLPAILFWRRLDKVAT
jgi:putative heme transporter